MVFYELMAKLEAPGGPAEYLSPNSLSEAIGQLRKQKPSNMPYWGTATFSVTLYPEPLYSEPNIIIDCICEDDGA